MPMPTGKTKLPESRFENALVAPDTAVVFIDELLVVADVLPASVVVV